MERFLSKIALRRQAPPSVPDGVRVYAIGDVHGEAGLLAMLLAAIERDSALRAPADTRIILLGDIIDRGQGAAELATALSTLDDPRMTVLMGNHEAALVDAYDGDEDAIDFLIAHGGLETLSGFAGTQIAEHKPIAVWSQLRKHVPASMIEWLRGLPLSVTVGDYMFVHAGIRPGVPLDRQRFADLLWIREPFLSSDRRHGKMIVHGHTPTDAIDRRSNRIGIDTGAYAGGMLTALGLEGSEQWSIDSTRRVAQSLDAETERAVA